MRSHAKATTAGSTERRSPGRRSLSRLAIAVSALVSLGLFLAPSSALAVEHPFLETFGPANQPSFVQAQGMAVDQSTGDVLVIDGNEAGGSLSRWHKDGTASNFSALGTNSISLAFGAAFEVQVAVDNSGGATDGNIYAATGSGGIKIFDEDGNSLGELTASSEGPLGTPCGVAVDGEGSVYVGDLSGAIHKYEPAASPPVNGDSTANFPFASNCSLAAGAGPTDGFIFASEFFGKVSKLDSTTGAEAYEVTASPTVTLSVDPSTGQLYAPTLEEKIIQFNAFGATEATVVSETQAPSFATGVAVDGGSGEFYLAYGSGVPNVDVFGPLSGKHPFLETFGPANQPSFVQAQGMAVDQSTGDVLVIDGNEAGGSLSRWHKDGTASNFSALGTNSISLAFGAAFEVQVAVDNSGGATDGNIYAATGSGGIKIFDEDGNSLGELTASSEGPLGTPCGVAVDGEGSVYVGDLSGAIHKYEPAASPPVNGDSTANFPFASNCSLAAGAGPTDGFIFASEFFGKVSKLDSTTGAEAYEVTASPTVTLSVDPSTGQLYAPTLEEKIIQFNAFGATEATVVSETQAPSFATGVAVDGGSGEFYLAYGSGVPNVDVFGPLSYVSPPSAATGTASAIKAVTATLNGTVNPSSSAITDCHFEYTDHADFLANGFANATDAPCVPDPGSGSADVAVSAGLSGLNAETEYDFRLVATNANGTAEGESESFTTTPAVKDLTTNPATLIKAFTATLNGSLDPDGVAITDCHFEYTDHADFLANGFANATDAPCVPPPGSGTGAVAVHADIGGLSADTAYDFRLVATNVDGTTEGEAEDFTTAAISFVDPATNVHHTNAVLNGHLDPAGDPSITSCEFEWGTDTSFSETPIPCAEGNSFSAPASVSAFLNDLTPAVTYHYRLKVTTTSNGESASQDETFVAAPWPTLAPEEIASFGPDGTSATSFSVSDPDAVAFDEAANRLYVHDESAAGIYGFDAASPPVFTPLSGFEPLGVGAGLGRTLAVDNSGQSSAGNIYRVEAELVHGLDSSGAPLGGNFPINPSTNPGGAVGSPTAISGLAVDSAGRIWVSNAATKRILRYSSSGTFELAVVAEVVSAFGSKLTAGDIAIGANDDLLLTTNASTVWKFTAASNYALAAASQVVLDNPVKSSLEVDPATNIVYTTSTSSPEVRAYEPSSSGHFGQGRFLYAFGNVEGAEYRGQDTVAVNRATHDIYAADRGNRKVRVFAPGENQYPPTVATGMASAITGTSARLNARVDPETFEVTDCHFEWGLTTSYGQSAPCEPDPGSGSGDVEVSAELTGLNSGDTFHFRILAANAEPGGTATGSDQAFKTLGPTIKGEAVSQVTDTDARVSGEINPNGKATSFFVEYVNEAQFLESEFEEAIQVPVPPQAVGAGAEFEPVLQELSGLTPQTTYRFRLVAANADATTEGAGGNFTTFSPPSAELLPDERRYEMVSPFQKVGEVIPPEPTANLSGSCDECLPGITSTSMPMQSTPDGEAVLYTGQPFSGGLAAGPNEYISDRGPDGWGTQSLSAPTTTGRYEAFSSDLSRGVLFQDNPPLSPEAPTQGEQGFPNLYLREKDGSLQPLVTEEPPHRGPGSFTVTYAGANPGTASAPAFSHLIFEANDALTAAVPGIAPEAPEVGGGQQCAYSAKCNLYEWAEGELRLVNVLPGNAAAAANAVLGSGRLLASGNKQYEVSDVDHAISDDGRRIFWSEETSGQVYVRVDGAETLEVPGPGSCKESVPTKDRACFLTASADGSEVLLADGQIYELDGEQEAYEPSLDLTDGQGGFEGILGASEDLARIYFVDTEALTETGEENGNGEHAEASRPNLYAWGEGVTTFLGTLYQTLQGYDNAVGVQSRYGVWHAPPSNRLAQVSTDGRYLTFMSRAALTGYDNSLSGGGECRNQGPACFEVFIYAADSETLSCASCNPSGQRPVGLSNLSLINPDAPFPQPSNLSADGDGRLFFESQDTLSTQDVNGDVQDVYQWEPNGVGSCERTAGCVSLISSGQSPVDSWFLDSTPSGDDVFFITREQLLPRDRDELLDLYDARVGGGIAEDTTQPCLGEACRGQFSAAPEQPGAASSTFAGPGNEKPKKQKKKKKKRRKHKRAAKHDRGGQK